MGAAGEVYFFMFKKEAGSPSAKSRGMLHGFTAQGKESCAYSLGEEKANDPRSEKKRMGDNTHVNEADRERWL